MINYLIRTLLLFLVIQVSACGGGSGGGNNTPITPITPTNYPSALNFEQPSEFLNGATHSTVSTIIKVQGELKSSFMPTSSCPSWTPPENFSVSWSNSATDETGKEAIFMGCVSNFGFAGVTSYFAIEGIHLELGNNWLTIDTFEGEVQKGRDKILIVREDHVAPTVIVNYPQDGQQEVSINHSLLVVFSEPMTTESLTNERFTLKNSQGISISGQLHYVVNHKTWKFVPDAPLVSLSQYWAVISSFVADSGGNNTMEADFTWSFITGPGSDSSPPKVVKHWPGNNCDCSPTSTRILAAVDEFIDPSSINENNIIVSSGDNVINGVTIYRGDYIEFIPNQELIQGTTYNITVSAGLSDLAGFLIPVDYNWEFTTENRTPLGSWYQIDNNQPPPAMSSASSVWTGTEVIVWGAQGGGLYEPLSDTWSTSSGSLNTNGPSSRFDHSAVWTGNEMIIWGGHIHTTEGEEFLSGGYVYNQSSGIWREIIAPDSNTSFPTYNHTKVWTGTEMIVWGGITNSGSSSNPYPINSGWRYNPTTNSTIPFSGTNAPSQRSKASSVWTGTEMIIWGGVDDNGMPLNDGARYNPTTDTWINLPSVGKRLVPGFTIGAVWTGTEMIVWNGGQTDINQTSNNQFREPTIHLYNPVTDTWRMSNSGWEPFMARTDIFVDTYYSNGFFTTWTGDKMFVVGRHPKDPNYF